MFYVVNLKKPRQNQIVPQTWILNSEKQMEKEMYFGVNSTQLVLCYYSPNAYDENGKPDKTVQPNFNLPVDGRFPSEGCFKARIKMFKSK